MIEVTGLGKSFGGRQVLTGVTFAVPEGEVFGLAGHIGAGRSTLLRMLATIVTPDEGDATIGGISVTADPEVVRTLIGYAPKVLGVYSGLDVQEHVEFYCGVHRLPRGIRARTASDLLDLVGLAARRHDDVGRLDSGERQRLGLAQALVHDPRVLLLDAVSGLDPAALVDVQRLLEELQALGKTIVVTTDHQGELAPRCSWLGILENGSMVTAGPCAELSVSEELLRLQRAP